MYVNSLLSHKETDALFFSWSKTHDSPLAKSIFKYTSEREREPYVLECEAHLSRRLVLFFSYRVEEEKEWEWKESPSKALAREKPCLGARACLRRLLSKRSPFFGVRPRSRSRRRRRNASLVFFFSKTKSKRSACCVLDKAVEKSVDSSSQTWRHHRRASRRRREAIERSRRRRRTRHRRRARTRGRTTDTPRKGTKRERENWCLVSSSPLCRERWVTSFYFSNASRAVAANKRTTTRFSLVLALATFVLTRSHFPCNKQATNGNFDRQRG